MKYTSLLSFMLFFVSLLHSQKILWDKSYGGKHAEYLMDAQPTADYGFILAGSSLSGKTGNKETENRVDLDYWLWKMDENGNLDWQKSFGGDGNDMLQSISLTNDGGFILGGTSASTASFDKQHENKGQDDFWIIKLNAKGGEEWQKTIGGNRQEKLARIISAPDGGYLVAGSSASGIGEDKKQDRYGSLDYWIVKLDNKGEIEWQNTYGGTYFDELRSVITTADGGYLIGGYSNSPASGNKSQDNIGIGDFWILKTDAKGTIEWQKTIGGDQDDQLFALEQAYDKGYIVAGNSNSGSGNAKTEGNIDGTDYWVLKLDENGEILWQKTYDIGKVDILTSVIENKDHSLLLSGIAQGEKKLINPKQLIKKSAPTNTFKDGTADYVVIKTDEKGEEQWRKDAGSTGEDILKKTIETRDGGYLLAGTSYGDANKDKSKNVGNNDFWVVKLKDEQKPDVVKASIEAIPNPAGNYTNVIVGYDFKEGTATLVDINGRQLQRFDIHSRTVPIDLTGLPEGIYIVNIKTDVQQDGVKIIKGITKN